MFFIQLNALDCIVVCQVFVLSWSPDPFFKCWLIFRMTIPQSRRTYCSALWIKGPRISSRLPALDRCVGPVELKLDGPSLLCRSRQYT